MDDNAWRELHSYIDKSFRAGTSEEAIKTTLTNSGWDVSVVDKALLRYRDEHSMQTSAAAHAEPEPEGEPGGRSPAAKVLITLGVVFILVMVAGVLWYAGSEIKRANDLTNDQFIRTTVNAVFVNSEEYFFENDWSYAGYCQSKETARLLSTEPVFEHTCVDNEYYWYIFAALSDGTYYCSDTYDEFAQIDYPLEDNEITCKGETLEDLGLAGETYWDDGTYWDEVDLYEDYDTETDTWDDRYFDRYTNDPSDYSILSQLEPSMTPVGYAEVGEPDENGYLFLWSDVEYFNFEPHSSTFDESRAQFPNQHRILSSIVKVVCETNGYFSIGSGTNVLESGYVITNRHVINDALYSGACAVGFPDPDTGLITEAYWASPIVDREDLTGHDLAYLSIEEPLYDLDGNVYGYVERMNQEAFYTLPQPEACDDRTIQLGDSLFILGYPPLSGGALTITDGLVSSLYSSSNYIITSAKIVSGNSGGAAIDRNGCYVGVPTAVYSEFGEESFGEIIDKEFVIEWDKAVADDFEEYLNAF